MEQKNWYDRNYKRMLVFSILLLIFSIGYMVYFYNQNNDFIRKDISLTGGTSATIYDENIKISQVELDLSSELKDLNVREISDLTTGRQKAIIIETTSNSQITKEVLDEYFDYPLEEGKNFDFEFTGALLSDSFYKQLIFALIIAFMLIGAVVFILYKQFIPSTIVILSSFSNILMTVAAVNILGIKMSTAGIMSLLMLLGYSIDTDILLTTKMLKKKELSINDRLSGALKTGLKMSLTSLFSFFIIFLIVSSFSNTLAQIFSVLAIGLCFDLINTWITNASLLKWYLEAKK